MKRYQAYTVWSLLLFLFCACNTSVEISSNLSGKQSIELVVALNRSGVSASREQSGGGRKANYRVLVAPGNQARALEVMHEYGLPRAVDNSLEEITRPRGFVPNTPQLAQLRFDHALELRVERAVLSLPGVIEARVVVQSNSASGVFSGKDVERGVSVVVRFLDVEARNSIAKADIQDLVAKAIPGVEAGAIEVRSVIAKISIDNSKADNLVQLEPFSFRVPRAELVTAGIQILVMFAAFCFAGIVAGAAWGVSWSGKQQAKRRRQMRTAISNEGGRSMFLEASLQENPQTKVSLPQVKDSGS